VNDHSQSAESTSDAYEAPAIAERTRVDMPLIGGASQNDSAAFHDGDAEDAYEPPAIAERTRVDVPLVAVIGSIP
jgi:hypothetical protein